MDADKIAREIDEAVEQLRISDDSRSTKDVCADVLRKHITPVDWPAVRREVAMRLWASDGWRGTDAQCCDAAITLVAEFQRRDEFGGGA